MNCDDMILTTKNAYFTNVKIDAQRRRKYVNQNELCPVNCRVANYKGCWIIVTNAILVSHGQTLKVEVFL